MKTLLYISIKVQENAHYGLSKSFTVALGTADCISSLSNFCRQTTSLCKPLSSHSTIKALLDVCQPQLSTLSAQQCPCRRPLSLVHPLGDHLIARESHDVTSSEHTRFTSEDNNSSKGCGTSAVAEHLLVAGPNFIFRAALHKVFHIMPSFYHVSSK